jgi:retron-type reverse transcriptase
MKTRKNLYPRICSFDNLLLAARKAARGKRSKPSTANFLFRLEPELHRIRRDLLAQTYKPGGYTRFTVRDTKPRVISAAPFRDRVVHHALCNVIEPIFDGSFIYDSYACRKGKGTHAAVDRYQAFSRKNRYVLKADIVRYFPSMDHEILLDQIRRRIACPKALWLIGEVLDSMKAEGGFYFPGDDLFSPFERPHGIPIGNLTSQFFANIHLNGFDHWVKETLGQRFYIRYVDDFVIFGNAKAALWGVLEACRERLLSLRLRLHPRKSRVYRTDEGIEFLGYRVFPTHRLLRKSNATHARRRLRKLQSAYRAGWISLECVGASIQSWVAHASHADTYHLRKKVLGQDVFARG